MPVCEGVSQQNGCACDARAPIEGGPRGQAMTQSKPKWQKGPFVFVLVFVLSSTRGLTGWVWFSLWLLVVDQLLWMGWMDLPFYGPALTVPEMNSWWFPRYSIEVLWRGKSKIEACV